MKHNLTILSVLLILVGCSKSNDGKIKPNTISYDYEMIKSSVNIRVPIDSTNFLLKQIVLDILKIRDVSIYRFLITMLMLLKSTT